MRGASASSGFCPSPPSYSTTCTAPRLASKVRGEGAGGAAQGWRRGQASVTRVLCALPLAPCLSASTLLPRSSTPSAGHTPTSPLSPRDSWTLFAAPPPSWSESKCASSSRSWRAPWKRYGVGRRGRDSRTTGVGPGLSVAKGGVTRSKLLHLFKPELLI